MRKSLTASESSEVSITKMLPAVVGVFGFCYSFEFIRRILSYVNYFEIIPPNAYYDYAINHLADIFYVFNSSVNFIIYCLLGRKLHGGIFENFEKSRMPFQRRGKQD
jgi:hypothetical protein